MSVATCGPSCACTEFDLPLLDAADLKQGMEAIAAKLSGGDHQARLRTGNRSGLLIDALAKGDHCEAGKLFAEWLVEELS